MGRWLLVLAAGLLPGGPASAAPPMSEQVLTVAPGVQLAGLLEDAAALAPGTLVIDLRNDTDELAAVQAEARLLLARGVIHAHLPTGRELPSASDLDWLAGVLDAVPGREVVLHCRTGNRAAMVWAAHLLAQGVASAEAQRRVAPLVTSATISAALAQLGPTPAAPTSRDSGADRQ